MISLNQEVPMRENREVLIIYPDSGISLIYYITMMTYDSKHGDLRNCHIHPLPACSIRVRISEGILSDTSGCTTFSTME